MAHNQPRQKPTTLIMAVTCFDDHSPNFHIKMKSKLIVLVSQECHTVNYVIPIAIPTSTASS